MGDEGKAPGVAEEEKHQLMAVLDFDMLCASVALQTQGIKANKNCGGDDEEEEEELGGELSGGVQRMWEGGLTDCLADRRIAVEAACCPCYSFGNNMRRANLGSCFLQGSAYFFLAIVALFNFIAFCITKQHCFLYVGVASTIAFGVYMGYFRTRIRKQFNIKGSDSYIDDCVSHLMCPCCSLCQESRTLEMNNVQDGMWHGRGDTICIGSLGKGTGTALPAFHKSAFIPSRSPELCSMARLSNDSSIHSWNPVITYSKPLVPSIQTGQQS